MEVDPENRITTVKNSLELLEEIRCLPSSKIFKGIVLTDPDCGDCDDEALLAVSAIYEKLREGLIFMIVDNSDTGKYQKKYPELNIIDIDLDNPVLNEVNTMFINAPVPPAFEEFNITNIKTVYVQGSAGGANSGLYTENFLRMCAVSGCSVIRGGTKSELFNESATVGFENIPDRIKQPCVDVANKFMIPMPPEHPFFPKAGHRAFVGSAERLSNRCIAKNYAKKIKDLFINTDRLKNPPKPQDLYKYQDLYISEKTKNFVSKLLKVPGSDSIINQEAAQIYYQLFTNMNNDNIDMRYTNPTKTTELYDAKWVYEVLKALSWFDEIWTFPDFMAGRICLKK